VAFGCSGSIIEEGIMPMDKPTHPDTLRLNHLQEIFGRTWSRDHVPPGFDVHIFASVKGEGLGSIRDILDEDIKKRKK
jgi:hypothetical protein